jgi:hypothetical protein
MTAMAMVARAAAVTLFGLGCMTLGARCASSSGPAQPAVSQRPAAPAVVRLSSDDRAELRRDVAEEVRRAVAAAMPAGGGPAAASASVTEEPAAAETKAAPTAAAVAAHETARPGVDDAVTRGAWRPEDGLALRETLANLDPAAYSDVVGELSRAVNTGRLQIVARDRPMF